MKAGLGHRENADTLLDLLRGADTDNSGSIDYTEFLAATMDAQIFLREDYLRTAFNMFDVDGSGKIDKTELISLLSGEGLENTVSSDLIAKYISEVD